MILHTLGAYLNAEAWKTMDCRIKRKSYYLKGQNHLLYPPLTLLQLNRTQTNELVEHE